MAYVWTTPRMQAAIWIAFLANLTAYPLSNGLLPYVARDDLRHQPDRARLSVGEFCDRLAGRLDRAEPDRRYPGGAADDRRHRRSGTRRLLVFVQMQTVPTAIACLMLAGFSQSLAMISIAVILMRTASENFRGRVMGVRMMVIYSLPLGLLAAGSLIDEIGFAATGRSMRPRAWR